MKEISYKGQTMVTISHVDITDSEYEQLKKEYYAKPDFSLVEKEFQNLYKGGVKHSNITNYYVKDLMAKTKIWYNKWSIEEVFECKELVEMFVARTQKNEKVFPNTMPLIKKVETALRVGGKGTASKPSNFPLKTVDQVLEKYNVNNYWYDFSCGWGDRLMGALKNKCNYFGTDPNYLLTDRLRQMTKDYKKANDLHRGLIDIRTQGSEKFVPEWKNRVGLAFSSPPYFYLEDYKIGEQSWKQGTSYNDWKENYLRPTFKNIKEYLIDNGYFLININNFKEFDLVGDTMKIAEQVGFEFVEYFTLENISRCVNTKSEQGFVVKFTDNNEKILVFKKK